MAMVCQVEVLIPIPQCQVRLFLNISSYVSIFKAVHIIDKLILMNQKHLVLVVLK